MAYPYISVYAPDETDFSHNGLRILCPLSCEITEVLNGEYSLNMTHPLDEWGNWRFVRENYIIKALGQLFRITRKTLSMSSDGGYEVKADAMHIFYDLNYCFIKDTRAVLKTGDGALDWIVSHTYSGDPKDRFDFSTDIKPSDPAEADDYKTAYYEKMSVTKALIGADNSFTATWGGEILRDNFNVMINKRRGRENVFSVRYGLDMTDISVETDFSDCCSAVYYEATVYNETVDESHQKQRSESVFTGLVGLKTIETLRLPYSPTQYYSFEISIDDIKKSQDSENAGKPPNLDEIKQACENRAKEYLLLNCRPSVNFRVSFADLKNYELYKDFIGLQEFDIGDTGTVYHEPLGLRTTQRIVKKTVDGITGKTVSIELGNLRRSLSGKANSALSERIKNESALENTWQNLGDQGFMMFDLKLSWDEIKGNTSVSSLRS